MIILLFIFYHFDMKAYRKDIAAGSKPDISKPGTEVKIRGGHNLIFIIMIVIAVILSGTLPSMPMFQDAAGNVLGIHVFGEVTLSYPAIIECVIILVSAFLSFKTTNVSIRRENHFTWGAIHEVAVLFVGIFITMQPALMILKANGAELGITKPFEMFWATGLLSSSRQYTDLPGIPHDSRCSGTYTGYGDSARYRSGQDAGGNLLRRRIHGREYLYRQRSELYGQIHCG